MNPSQPPEKESEVPYRGIEHRDTTHAGTFCRRIFTSRNLHQRLPGELLLEVSSAIKEAYRRGLREGVKYGRGAFASAVQTAYDQIKDPTDG